MKSYYRIMLGKKSAHAQECYAENYIAAFGIDQDLTGNLPEEWRTFNKQFIPIFLAEHPDKTKIAAGLACGVLWTISKGIRKGDAVLCPDGSGSYRVGEVSDDYTYQPGVALPHRRPVQWLSQTIDRADMSAELKSSSGAIGTVINVSGYREEIEKLIGGSITPTVVSTD